MKLKTCSRRILNCYLVTISIITIAGCYTYSTSSNKQEPGFRQFTGNRYFSKIYIAYHDLSTSPGLQLFTSSGIKTILQPNNTIRYESRKFFRRKKHAVEELKAQDKITQYQSRGIPAGSVVRIVDVETGKKEFKVTITCESMEPHVYGLVIIQTGKNQITELYLERKFGEIFAPVPQFENLAGKMKYIQSMYGQVSTKFLTVITGVSEQQVDKIYFSGVMTQLNILEMDSSLQRFRRFVLETGPGLVLNQRLLIREINIRGTPPSQKLYVRFRYLNPLNLEQQSRQGRAGIMFQHVFLPLSEICIGRIPLDIGLFTWDMRYKLIVSGKTIIEKQVVSFDRHVFARYKTFEITAQELANQSTIKLNDEEVEINLSQIRHLSIPIQQLFD
jgi:hypothetical protein